MLEVDSSQMVVNEVTEMVPVSHETSVNEAVSEKPTSIEPEKPVTNASEIESTSECGLGPWNIPKYVIKKKKQNQIGGKSKEPTIMKYKETQSKKKDTIQEEGQQPGMMYADVAETQRETEAIPQMENKQTTSSRVRNPSAGKNPQQVKLKTGTSVGPNTKPKDKVAKNAIPSKDTRRNENTSVEVGKENSKSLTKGESSLTIEEKQAEDQAMLAYMKVIYKTRGEALLKKFRGEEPIRKALTGTDGNDSKRMDSLRQRVNLELSKDEKIKELEEATPMEIMSRIKHNEHNGSMPMDIPGVVDTPAHNSSNQ